MPATSKGIGQAWFYHAPTKPSGSDKVPTPPLSQIPDLNGYCSPASPPSQSMRNVIYESDSSYMRLAKQGGRPDLLNMMPNDCRASSEPVGYPRCEWYYDGVSPLANNCKNNENTKPYVFKLPAYMVHPESKPRQSNDGYLGISSSGAPTVFVRELPAATECNSNNSNQRAARKHVKKPPKMEPNPPCKPPTDHLGPNCIHKY